MENYNKHFIHVYLIHELKTTSVVHSRHPGEPIKVIMQMMPSFLNSVCVQALDKYLCPTHHNYNLSVTCHNIQSILSNNMGKKHLWETKTTITVVSTGYCMCTFIDAFYKPILYAYVQGLDFC